MLERIREILSSRKLTSTQFADAIGVARPVVSHILSGRNKPSLEVVQKISAAFPDLSLAWLLSGEGSMLAARPTRQATNSETAPADLPRPKPDSIPARSSERAIRAAKNESAFLASAIEVAREAPAQATPVVLPDLASSRPETPASVPAATPALTATTVAPSVPVVKDEVVAQSLAEPGKAIRRIVIFYQDGTFSDFRPE